jgi:hypothetical protein
VNVNVVPEHGIEAHLSFLEYSPFEAGDVDRAALGGCGDRGFVNAWPWKGKAWTAARENRSRSGTYIE